MVPRLSEYDSERFGPLFAVSDDGGAAETIVDAAYSSAKAEALAPIDPLRLGVALDGERMTSAGEVPIGPPEYEDLIEAARGRLLLTTNVGVRSNARLQQALPEIMLTKTSATDSAWVDSVVAKFTDFLRTPDGRPRPLMVRLGLDPKQRIGSVRRVMARLNQERAAGKIGPAELHRFSLLIDFSTQPIEEDQVQIINDAIKCAANAGISEVAIDGPLLASSRRRLGVQSLLNVVDLARLRRLLATACSHHVNLAYRYQLDVESAARTIWTGLRTAQTHGFSAGKYGLVPMTIEEQAAVIELIERWTVGWTAIPAFYVDIPLLSSSEVFDVSQCKEAAMIWLRMARGAGATIVLFDSPDRVDPRRLIRESNTNNGVLTLADIEELLAHARELGVSILWSGGVAAKEAFQLARRKVFGIFSTSSTAAKVAVTAALAEDPRLASENEPTHLGVRRIHALVQAGFLREALRDHGARVATAIEASAQRLLAIKAKPNKSRDELRTLNTSLMQGWQILAKRSPHNEAARGSDDAPVAANAVRVFRGRKRDHLDRNTFLDKLGNVFIPMTVQMQRLYGLTAYLPAVLPETKRDDIPDEVALVFYRTQKSYHDAKRRVGGRAYSELHDLVFNMPASISAFPKHFKGKIEAGATYHLFFKSVDWQKGSSRLCVATRRAGLDQRKFLDGVGRVASQLQIDRDVLDGVIFCPSPNSLLWWEHSSRTSLKPNFRFEKIAKEAFGRIARRVQVPTNLLRPYGGIGLKSQGDFLNCHFQRQKHEDHDV